MDHILQRIYFMNMLVGVCVCVCVMKHNYLIMVKV